MMGGEREGSRIGQLGLRVAQRGWYAELGKQAKQGLAHSPVLLLHFPAFPAGGKPGIGMNEPRMIVVPQSMHHPPEKRAIECGESVLERAVDPVAGCALVGYPAGADCPFQAARVGESADRKARADQSQEVQRDGFLIARDHKPPARRLPIPRSPIDRKEIIEHIKRIGLAVARIDLPD